MNRTNRLPDMDAELARIAAQMGCTLERLHRAATACHLHTTPGKLLKGEKPLPRGSIINLRREFPGTPAAARDLRWVVSGYKQKADGRWSGYTLHRGAFDVETSTLSNCEAFDLVELYVVPAT